MITARARAPAGSRRATSVTRSPFGSITTTPRPARMSARIGCTSRVDLPEPVAPMTCRWWRASATRTPTGRPRRTPRAAAASSRPRPDHPSDVVAVAVSAVLVVVSPRGLTSGPGAGTPGGGATDRAPARSSPGVCSAVGRAAIAASSADGEQVTPRRADGRRSRGGAEQAAAPVEVVPAKEANTAATAWARPRTRRCAAVARRPLLRRLRGPSVAGSSVAAPPAARRVHVAAAGWVRGSAGRWVGDNGGGGVADQRFEAGAAGLGDGGPVTAGAVPAGSARSSPFAAVAVRGPRPAGSDADSGPGVIRVRTSRTPHTAIAPRAPSSPPGTLPRLRASRAGRRPGGRGPARSPSRPAARSRPWLLARGVSGGRRARPAAPRPDHPGRPRRWAARPGGPGAAPRRR